MCGATYYICITDNIEKYWDERLLHYSQFYIDANEEVNIRKSLSEDKIFP